ncbi:MAG: cyclic nucleotide-binding domain-containing protein [Vulcanimicrobiota bacterium]
MALNAAEIEELQTLFEFIGFMDCIPYGTFEELTLKFNKVTFEAGDAVVKQGRSGGAFFILARGIVAVWVEKNGEKVKVGQIAPITYFGEIALLESSERIATLVAEDQVEVFMLGKKDFFEYLYSNEKIRNMVDDKAALRKKDTGSKTSTGEEVPQEEDYPSEEEPEEEPEEEVEEEAEAESQEPESAGESQEDRG